jgi:antitoxin component YwqK of YwqJK toxin-antitoxin module
MVKQASYIIVVIVMNISINTTKYLKNIYILYMCVCFPFLNVSAQNHSVDLHLCNSGTFTQFLYPSGSVSSEGCLNKGSADGVWTTYFEDGKIKSRGEYLNNQLTGKWLFYYVNSSLEKELNYYEDKKNGVEINYSEDGIILKYSNWINDLKEGEERRYYPDGIIQHVSYFEEGIKEGKGRQYARDGRIIAFKTYKNGVIFSSEIFNRFDKEYKKTALWKDFYESLIIREEGPFTEGLKHGIFRYYDPRGDLIDIIRYELGIEKEDEDILDTSEVIRIYHPNGQIAEESVYKRGLRDGVSREYNEVGEIIGGGVYYEGILLEKGKTDKQGNKTGLWKFYYKYGEIKSEGIFMKSLREGSWIFYYETGEIEQKGNYAQGEFDGKWQWWFINTEIKREEHYKKGVEDGDFIEYDRGGQILLEGVYKEGKRDGEWLYHVNDHREVGAYINGKKDGVWIHSYKEGKRRFRGEYSYGEPVGLHRVWSEEGKLLSTGHYKNGVKHGKWEHFTKEGLIDHTYKHKYGDLLKVDGRRVLKNKQS